MDGTAETVLDSTEVAALAALQHEVASASTELFAAYGVALTALPQPEAAVVGDGEGVASIIGYTGEHVRGALVLFAERPFAESLQPDVAQAGDDALRDVFGEFANMLLGRVKNQLLRRAVVLQMATPTTSFGRDLRILAPKVGSSAWHAFESVSGRVFVRFDVTMEPGFVLGEPVVEPGEAPAVEGDLMMF